MSLRRKAVSPQNQIAVLNERIGRIEKQIRMLRQAGPSTLQADDYENAVDPVPWETIIHHPGVHTPAAPTDPLVYYHPGDEDIGGSTVPGFKAIGASALAWISVYDNFVYGNIIDNTMSIAEVYFPFMDRSDGSDAIFGYDAVDGSLTLGCDWTYRPILKVDGIYSFGFTARSENALNRSMAQNRLYIGGTSLVTNPFEYPGQVAINWLSYYHDRNHTGFNQSYSRWGRTWTLPIKVVSPPQPVTLWHAILKQIADTSVTDVIEYSFTIVYHGPINHAQNLNQFDDPGPP